MNIAGEIKDRLSLAEVVEAYTGQTLKKGKMRCPFHDEKTASFTVFQNNTFYCFGCGASGDVFEFVKKYFGIGFAQAIIRLNLDFGLGLPVGGRVDMKTAIQRKRKLQAERAAKIAQKNEIEDEYWKWFDTVRELENTIDIFRPCNDNEMTVIFTQALSWLDYAKYRLDISEARRTKYAIEN